MRWRRSDERSTLCAAWFDDTLKGISLFTTFLDAHNKDIRRLIVTVSLDYSGNTVSCTATQYKANATVVGVVVMTSRSSWDAIDADICRAFNEYLHR